MSRTRSGMETASRQVQPWKRWITNDKAYSSWNVDAVVEYGAGADHDRDGCRVAGSVRALFALQGNRNRPVQWSAGAIRQWRDPACRGIIGACEGRLDWMERYILRLAGL